MIDHYFLDGEEEGLYLLKIFKLPTENWKENHHRKETKKS